MGLFDAIFGGPTNTFVDSTSSNLNPNTFTNQGQYAQNMAAQQYSAMLGQGYGLMNKPRWVYNGIDCSLKEFADLMFNDDEEGKLMFILKHGGV